MLRTTNSTTHSRIASTDVKPAFAKEAAEEYHKERGNQVLIVQPTIRKTRAKLQGFDAVSRMRVEDAIRDVEDAQRDLLDWMEDWRARMKEQGK